MKKKKHIIIHSEPPEDDLILPEQGLLPPPIAKIKEKKFLEKVYEKPSVKESPADKILGILPIKRKKKE